jgi:hypothetical protein
MQASVKQVSCARSRTVKHVMRGDWCRHRRRPWRCARRSLCWQRNERVLNYSDAPTKWRHCLYLIRSGLCSTWWDSLFICLAECLHLLTFSRSKAVSLPAMLRGREIWLIFILTSALGVSCQRHSPAALYPRVKDSRYQLDRRLGGLQSRSGHRG